MKQVAKVAYEEFIDSLPTIDELNELLEGDHDETFHSNQDGDNCRCSECSREREERSSIAEMRKFIEEYNNS
jgi:hypothetical protein